VLAVDQGPKVHWRLSPSVIMNATVCLAGGVVGGGSDGSGGGGGGGSDGATRLFFPLAKAGKFLL
jgi:hypothetical protein